VRDVGSGTYNFPEFFATWLIMSSTRERGPAPRRGGLSISRAECPPAVTSCSFSFIKFEYPKGNN